MTKSDWVWLVLGLCSLALVYLFVKWAQIQDYINGRKAYYHGLPRNPAWGKDVLKGYDDAAQTHTDR